MILCQCTGVTDRTIEHLIAEGASTVAEITRRCGAGRCCACCREEIAGLLYSAAVAAHNPETGHFTNDAVHARDAGQGETCHEGECETD